MIPDYLIIDEIRRRQQERDRWEPESLRLPLYVPHLPTKPKEEEDTEESDSQVIIIDM